MKDYAKCTLADMILKYIGDLEGKDDDLKEEDDGEEEEDIFSEKPMGKPKIVVKSVKVTPKKA